MPTNTRNLAALVGDSGAFVVAANGNIAIANTTSTIAAKLHIEDPAAQAAGTPIAVIGTPSAATQASEFSDGLLVGGGLYGLAHAKHADVNSGGPGLVTYRSRGTSGSETAVDNGDYTGVFVTIAHDGSGYTPAGYLLFAVDETVRSITTGNIPTRFSVVINDGAGQIAPLGSVPSPTAGYADTTINGTLYVQGPTAQAAVVATSNDVNSAAIYAQAQNDTTDAYLAHLNTYTFLGVGGTIENRAAGISNSLYSIILKDSAQVSLFSIRADGLINTGTRTFSPYTLTTMSASNMHVASDGSLYRSDTSSARFKENVQPLDDEWADKILDLDPVFYESTAPGDASNPDWTYYGFIAEEVAQVDGRYVHFNTGYVPADPARLDKDGKPDPRPATPRKPQNEWVADGVQYSRLVVPLINIAKRQRARIEALEAQVSDLTAQLTSLADRVTALET